MKNQTDALVRLARINTAIEVPILFILSLIILLLRIQGSRADAERIISWCIGMITGWLIGLWACCFYLGSRPQKDSGIRND